MSRRELQVKHRLILPELNAAGQARPYQNREQSGSRARQPRWGGSGDTAIVPETEVQGQVRITNRG